MPLRIAYFVNQYPKVSHTFIRREIKALEDQGSEILRLALRGWDEDLVDEADLKERSRTRYVLRDGIPGLLLSVLRVLLTAPVRFVSGLSLAVTMNRYGEKSILYHIAYLAEACRMLPWIRSFGATHLHAHFGINSAEIAMLVHALGGPPYSFTAHGTEFVDRAPFLNLDEKVRRAAFVVAVSSYGRSQLYRWTEHALWPKIRIVRCGLEEAYFLLPQLLRPTAPRLVCVGRLSAEKGQLLLVEAAGRLARKGMTFELVLAGDGEMRPQIEALVAELGLSRNIRITGWIGSDRVRTEILAARALVVPSFAEGLPVVIMEAMALRRPVLATYVGGIPELVQHGKNGWLVPAGSIEVLADSMEDLLSMPSDELKRMGDTAHGDVVAHHSIETEAAKLAVLFQESSRLFVERKSLE